MLEGALRLGKRRKRRRGIRRELKRQSCSKEHCDAFQPQIVYKNRPTVEEAVMLEGALRLVPDGPDLTRTLKRQSCSKEHCDSYDMIIAKTLIIRDEEAVMLEGALRHDGSRLDKRDQTVEEAVMLEGALRH